ncbi:right-handed parallel beta-helix repeat-containing protein [Methanobrevibacter sp.]
MFKKINFILVLLLLLVSVGAVSAANDFNETIGSEKVGIDEVSSDVLASNDDEIITSSSHTVNKSNYYNYFDPSSGELKDSTVGEGDTINLDGEFSGVNFVFKKSINVVGTDNVRLQNCMFTFKDDASGSSVSNLKIFNTKETTYGIFLNGVNNCIIQGCFINNTGASSYAVCVANNANYNNVSNNNLNAYGITYGHGTRSTSPLLISGAHNNYIANNKIGCDDANAIYLSSYSGGPLKGGDSNFNIIYNNTIKYNVLPTSWSYGIQVMGGSNTINSNRVIGAYRGISTSGSGNKIINNYIINLTGADYNHPTIEVAGDIAIVGSYYSTIINNTILNAKVLSSGAGISVLDNCLVENNNIQVIYKGTGIHAQGSNIELRNNNISTLSGSGILYNTYSYNLDVIGNHITSQSGVGILIQKLSSKRMPGNITIINNYIKTGNTYAIDARGANANSNNNIKPELNTIPPNGGKIVTPEGEFDPSKPVYNFDGKTYVITPSNIDKYIDENVGFKAFIKDGDIIKFNGVFSNEFILVNAAVKVNGENATFYNTTFRVSSDGVWMENLVIRNNQSSRLNSWGVVVYRATGVTIQNSDIEVCDPNAAYAIYVVESEDVDVLNNMLYSSGNYLTYTLLAHTVEDCKFINNTIKTVGTGKLYINSGGETCIDGNCIDGDENCLDGSENCIDGSCFDGNHVVREVYRTYGILMIYASGNIVSGNKVNVTSKLNMTVPFNESTNSIVGIDLYYNSHSNIFSDNVIVVWGNDNYIYGMGVLGYYTGHDAPEGQGATDNQFVNNNINLAGNYFVEGIVIGDESENTKINSNIVNAISNHVAYGINLEMSQNSNIDNNNFTLNSHVVYGIEAFASSNNNVTNNNFDINAKQAYGFALSNSKNNDIYGNVLVVNTTGENISFKVHDVIAPGNAGISIQANSTANIITDNKITVNKGYSIDLDEYAVDNNIEDNYLDSEFGVGNSAVNNTSKNIIEGNYKYEVTGNLEPITIKYFENGTFIFKTDDGNLEGATVNFIDLMDDIVGSSKIIDGVAQFEYNFPKYTPADYLIYAKVLMDNYRITKFQSTLRINDGDLNLSVINTTGAIARNAEFKAIVKNILGNGVSGITIKFYINDEEFKQYIAEAITDNGGIASVNAIVPQIYSENPEVIAVIENPSYFHSISGTANLTAYKLISTNIVVSNNNVYPNGVVAILKDEKGNLLNNQKVAIRIGSSIYYQTTNADGTINMPVLSKGSYIATFVYDGDAHYYDYKTNAKINILPSIYENSDKTVYYGNTIIYKVRIKGFDGNYHAKNTVVMKINGKTYKVLTDKNGYAAQVIKLKTGSYTISVEFNGDKVINKLTFKPTLTAKNIVKKKAKKIKFSVKVVNKNGKAVKHKKVTFKIKGKKYTAKTNKKGVAIVSIKNLKVGKFTITSSYGGCTIKNTIKIKK